MMKYVPISPIIHFAFLRCPLMDAWPVNSTEPPVPCQWAQDGLHNPSRPKDGGRVVVDLVAAERWDLGKVDAGPRWEVQDPTQAPKRSLVRYEVAPEDPTTVSYYMCEDLPCRHLLQVSATAAAPRWI